MASAAAAAATSDRHHHPYGEQVLGETVWIQFDHDDGSASSYYRGTVTEFHIVMDANSDRVPDDSVAERTHVVAFDDGDKIAFDLAEEERAGRLRWQRPPPAASAAVAVTPPRNKRVKREAALKQEDSEQQQQPQEEEEDVKPKARIMKHETDSDQQENTAEQEEQEDHDEEEEEEEEEDEDNSDDDDGDDGDVDLDDSDNVDDDEREATHVELSPEVRRVLNQYGIPASAFAQGIERVSACIDIEAFPVKFEDLFPLLDFMIPANGAAGESTHVDVLYTDRANRPGNTARRFLRGLKKHTSRNETEEAAVGWHETGKQWDPKNPAALRALLTVLHGHYEEWKQKTARK